MEKFVIINHKTKNFSLLGSNFNSPDNNLNYFDLYNDFINSPLKLNYSSNKRNLLYNINKIFYNEMHSNESKKEMFHGTLAYGEVQSGKTMNMIASMFKAYDLGFRNFVVLTGSITDLHEQTITRFKTEKRELNDFINNETEFEKYSSQVIEKELYDQLNLTPQIEFWNLSELTSRGDFIEFKNSANLNQLNVIFCLKEDDNLAKLENLFRNYSNLTKNRNGTILIDDEIDWGFKMGAEEKKIYDTIKNIQHVILQDQKYLKYVGFTATPYKILENYEQTLINDIVLLKNKKINPEFLPEIDDSFFLKNNPFYVGLDFFHTNNFQLPNWKGNKVLQEVFTREYISIINESELSDTTIETFLEKSLYLYLMNSFLFAKSSQEKNLKCKATFALFFVDLQTNKHDFVYEVLEKTINKIAEKNKINQSIFDLIDSYKTDLDQLLNSKRAKILVDYSQKAFDSFVLDWVDFNLKNNYNLIIKMYGNNLVELEKEKNKNYNNNFIVIGGFKISRGVTFPNLLLEVIIPASINKASTLQRARWFGFRNLENLLNLDLLMTQKTKKSFEEAAEHDLNTKRMIEENSKLKIA